VKTRNYNPFMPLKTGCPSVPPTEINNMGERLSLDGEDGFSSRLNLMCLQHLH
jgi:hypothetical protein